MTDHPPRPKPECAHEHWRVEVSTCGKQIVAIETECLAGREISDADAETIRTCARHLLAFLGDTPGDPAQQVPPPAAEPVSDPYKLRDAQEEQEPVAWQWRAIISGNPTSWLHMEETVVKFRYRYAEELRQGIYELRPLFASPQQGQTISEADVLIVAGRLRGQNALKDDYGQIQQEKVRKALEASSLRSQEATAKTGDGQ